MWYYLVYGLSIVMTKLFCNYGDALDLNELKYYELVEPYHVGIDGRRRDRRDLSTFSLGENKHMDETAFIFSGYNRSFSLRIHKNNLFMSKSFNTIYQNSDGSYRVEMGVDNCVYEKVTNSV